MGQDRERSEEYRKAVAKARPQQTSISTLSPVSIPYLEDMEPGTLDQHCPEGSKLMIRLLRHDDSVNREEDGAVKFEDQASHWSTRTWLSFLQRGGGIKRTTHSPETFLCLPAIQGHSGGTHVDLTLQDNVLLPDFAEHTYHPVCIDSG